MFFETFANIMLVEKTEMLLTIIGLHKLMKVAFTKKWRRHIIATLTFFMVFLCIIIGGLDEIRVYFSLLTQILVILLIFEEKFYKKLLLYLTFYMFIGMIMAGIIGILGFIFNNNMIKIASTNRFQIMFNLIFTVLSLIISAMIKQVNVKRISWYNLLLLFFIMLFWAVILLYIIFAKGYNTLEFDYAFLFVCSLLGCFLTLIALLVLIKTDMSRRFYIEQQLFQDKIIEMQKEHYNRLYEDDKKVRRFRHDMNIIMDCINQLEENKDYEKLKRLVLQANLKIKEIPKQEINIGNKLVNAVINRLYEEVHKDNIHIIIEGCLFDDIKISEIDLCILFFNTLSNAIEACKKLNHDYEKNISILIKTCDSALNILIENPVIQPVDIKLLGKDTTKHDKKNHGFGIMNVVEIVEKNNGEIYFLNQDYKFIVSIIFYDVASHQKMSFHTKRVDS